jgi:hypothetical protein
MTPKEENAVAIRSIQGVILDIRGQKVILDSDLAALYGVPAKRLNEQVRRNAARFPPDFVFQLTQKEAADLRSQSATSSSQDIGSQYHGANRSQIATGSSKHRDPRFSPFVFTEHGALMAANVLRSPKAAEMSVFIVRAFVQMRGTLISQYEMAGRVDQIEKILLVHDVQLKELFDMIRPLLLPPPEPPAKSIGFCVKESRGKYRVRRGRRKK